jgi:GT2 family glycosyltransferase
LISQVHAAKIPDVSVIVVSYNTRDLTAACLHSVLSESADIACELIVVDNASSDGSAEMVAAEFPDVHLIANTENVGFAKANNQAFQLARGRYLLLLNPDTLVVNDAIARTVEFADSMTGAGVIGCRVLWPDGEQSRSLYRFRRLRDVALNLFVPNRLTKGSSLLGGARYAGIDLDRVQDVEVVAGCFMLVRSEILDQVGGMDEDFFMYGEESEWCFRIRKAGWSVLYFPGARIVHLGGQSTKQKKSEMNLAMARGQLLFLEKTWGWHASYLANLMMLLRDSPRVCLWLLCMPIPRLRESEFGRSLKAAVQRLPMLLRGLFREHRASR